MTMTTPTGAAALEWAAETYPDHTVRSMDLTRKMGDGFEPVGAFVRIEGPDGFRTVYFSRDGDHGLLAALKVTQEAVSAARAVNVIPPSLCACPPGVRSPDGDWCAACNGVIPVAV